MLDPHGFGTRGLLRNSYRFSIRSREDLEVLREFMRPVSVVLTALLIAPCARAAMPMRSPHADLGWATDIDFIASELPKRHPKPFTYVTAAEFNTQLNAIKTRSATLSNAAVV